MPNLVNTRGMLINSHGLTIIFQVFSTWWYLLNYFSTLAKCVGILWNSLQPFNWLWSPWNLQISQIGKGHTFHISLSLPRIIVQLVILRLSYYLIYMLTSRKIFIFKKLLNTNINGSPWRSRWRTSRSTAGIASSRWSGSWWLLWRRWVPSVAARSSNGAKTTWGPKRMKSWSWAKTKREINGSQFASTFFWNSFLKAVWNSLFFKAAWKCLIEAYIAVWECPRSLKIAIRESCIAYKFCS